MTIARLAFHAFTVALVAAAIADVGNTARAADACDRAWLRGFITRYLDAMVAYTPDALPVSPTLRFTEDYVDMKLGEGLWKQVSKIRPYRLDILGVAQRVAASQVVVEANRRPVGACRERDREVCGARGRRPGRSGEASSQRSRGIHARQHRDERARVEPVLCPREPGARHNPRPVADTAGTIAGLLAQRRRVP